MKIASDIVKGGVTVGDSFKDAITALIREERLTKIIETGTYLGEGTTRAIIEGVSELDDLLIYSIECNPKYYRQAVQNNILSPVNFLLGLSVGKRDLPVDITFDVPDYVVVDHQPRDREKLYRQEVSFPVNDNMLDHALSKMNYAPDLVILDSAGHMGMVEFKYLIEKVVAKNEGHQFYIALDDTNHVKHYHTMEVIKDMSDRFTIIFETDDKFGSAIVKMSPVGGFNV